MGASASSCFCICAICGFTWRIQQRYVNTGLDEMYLVEDLRTLGPVALARMDYAAWGASAARWCSVKV